MAKQDKKEQNVDPSRLDELADQKYAASLPDKTDLLNRQAGPRKEDERPDFKSVDDGASSLDEEVAVNEDNDNVSEEEAKGLDEAASRMPEEDDILDQDFLDEEDSDGTPLNESDDSLGEDLDISTEDEDANIYDDNE